MLNDFVLVQKCYRPSIKAKDSDVEIFRTDFDTELTHIAEIVDVGPTCRYYLKEHIGSFVVCPEISPEMHYIENSFYAIREKELLEKFGAIIYADTK